MLNKNHHLNAGKTSSDHSSDDVYFLGRELKDLPNPILKWVDEECFTLITVLTVTGEILYVSSAMHSLLGYSKKDILHKHAFDYILKDDIPYILKKLEKEPDKKHTFMCRLHHQSGHYLWVEMRVIRVSDDQDGHDYFVTFIRDITEKKEAEEILVRSEKMSVAGQLAAGIAHEIRNPITSLKGFLQLMNTGIEGKEQYLKIMADEIEKIEHITSELLFISKPLTDDHHRESLNELLDDVCTLMQSQARLHDVQIMLNQSDEIFINCDRSQIKQVFINIIKNAIEVMEDGGTIQVIVIKHDQHVDIDIVDEGPGIPDELLDKINEPFFTTKKNGTGLGLMITNQILTKHKGELTVIRNKTRGTTFRVTLPISDENER
ncbi:two-component system sporulation sensor kinase A [Melghiribacillus thermohalophilus]|uniref:histidine kinase n=1 Tax=Melghiribacillus thermohalophilus TaxID=1324956 RepID=A0A4R3NAM4_9BACI|nr:two-component system sporulation sensor kinase A [Melghiribacillus thermohalophilus]